MSENETASDAITGTGPTSESSEEVWRLLPRSDHEGER